MNVTEFLQIADRLVFTKIGKHLDDIQESVVKGVYEGKSYETIATECNRSESRIRNVGRELWQILSEQLGEDVTKSNFRFTIERFNNSLFGIGINSSFNSCPLTKDTYVSNRKEDESNITQDVSYDLTIAPKITHFYGRDQELANLSKFILEQNTSLTSVLGFSGIGKTTVVKRFVDLNKEKFNLVIWRSLKFTKSLDSLLDELLKIIDSESNSNTNDKFIQLFDYLEKKRCLIILDDVQELFIGQQFTGQYQKKYKDYRTFFRMMTDIEHQSSLILISREKCQEMLCLDEELYAVKVLEIEGLHDIKFFKNQGLQDEEMWTKLIDLYEGNPVYLKDITILIRDIFLGKTSDFLQENSLFLTENIKSQITELFTRLSPIEQEIVSEINKCNQPVSREDLRKSLSLDSMELINGLQSLQRRYLIQTIESEKVVFNLSPVIKRFLTLIN